MNLSNRKLYTSVCAAFLGAGLQAFSDSAWPAARAQAWAEATPWLVGCNFTPSTAVNQLEMWQADTFDPKTIDRELGWANQLGFTCVRVFLHLLPWQEDHSGFCERMDEFLALADRHHVKVMFVLLDGVWDPFPRSGRQPPPKPGVHGSRWVQCPGAEILKMPQRHQEVQSYLEGVIGHFKNDHRVIAWDIFNEPDNLNKPAYFAQEPTNKVELSLALLRKAYAWARAAKPSQPLTSGVWIGTWADPAKLSPIERFMLEESDIISFHNYGPLVEVKQCVDNLRRYRRPILCTEYMARPRGSTFDPILGYLRQQRVGAFNWGFVAGKTQTIYGWESWDKPCIAEPRVWFHDILRADGTPFDIRETAYIRRVTIDQPKPADTTRFALPGEATPEKPN